MVVRSLADALRMLKEQAARTPAPQWVRVVGSWKGIYPDSKND
jgi:predicted amidohydrolase YtcJ